MPWCVCWLAAALPFTPAPTPAEIARREALIQFGVGEFRLRAERPARALQHFEAAAKSDPAALPPMQALVPLYADLGRPAAAIRVAREVLSRDPADADTAQRLGQLLYEGNQPGPATLALRQALDSPRVAKSAARQYGLVQDLTKAALAAKDWPELNKAARQGLRLLETDRAALRTSPFFPAEADFAAAQASLLELYGQALVGEKQYPAAAEAFKQAAAAGPAPAAVARLAWNLSGAYAEAGQNEAALEQLNLVLARKPGTVAPYERLALLLNRLNRGDRVVPTLEALAAANPNNAALPWLIAEELGRATPEAAVKRFRGLADAATSEDAPFGRMARFYGQAGRAGELLDLLDSYAQAVGNGRALRGVPEPRREPPDPAAVQRLRGLVRAMQREPGFDQALVRHLRQTPAALANRHDDTRQVIVSLAEQAGALDAVEAALRASFGGGDPDAAQQLLAVLERQRKWGQVLALIAQLQVSLPNRNWEFYRAHPLLELDRGAEALQSLDRAAAADAGNSDAVRVQRAHALTVTGRPRDAVALLEKLIADNPALPSLPRARMRLAEAHTELGEYAKADACYEAILDADPDDAEALNNYAYHLAEQGRKLPEAEAMLRRAVEIDRDERLRAGASEAGSGNYLDSLGWVLFRRGKFAEAKAALELAARSQEVGAHAVVWDHLGDVHFRLGETAAARAAWQKAATLYERTLQGRQHGRRADLLRKLEASRE